LYRNPTKENPLNMRSSEMRRIWFTFQVLCIMQIWRKYQNTVSFILLHSCVYIYIPGLWEQSVFQKYELFYSGQFFSVGKTKKHINIPNILFTKLLKDIPFLDSCLYLELMLVELGIQDKGSWIYAYPCRFLIFFLTCWGSVQTTLIFNHLRFGNVINLGYLDL